MSAWITVWESHHAARHTVATTAQRLGHIRMVITTGMDHQRVAFDL